jgi:hypothetical protein
MPRSAVWTWLALLGTGCASAAPAGRAIAYRPDRAAEVRAVPKPAHYLLSRTDDPARPDGKVLALRELGPGDSVGFAREAGGTLVAVAGADRIPLADERRYRWQATEPGRQDRLAAAGAKYMGVVEPVGNAFGTVLSAVLFVPLCLFLAIGGGGVKWG